MANALPAWHGKLSKLWDVSCQMVSEDLRPPPPNALEPLACKLCRQVCKGRRGLAAHTALRHGLRSKFRRLVSGTQCVACGVQFHTRSRLLKHVQRYNAVCRRFYLEYVAHVSAAEQDDADRSERLRLKGSRGRGRFDRAVAIKHGAPVIPLAESDSEEAPLFVLEDFI